MLNTPKPNAIDVSEGNKSTIGQMELIKWTIHAFLLSGKAKMFCVNGSWNEEYSCGVFCSQQLVIIRRRFLNFSALPLCVKAKLFCVDGLKNEEYSCHVLCS